MFDQPIDPAHARPTETPLAGDESAAENCPEPEAIQETRKVVGSLLKLIDAGEVEAVSIYVQRRDGCYQNMQSQSVSRHEDAGRILELAVLRLGFRLPADLAD